MTQRIALDQIIDAAPARVVVTRDQQGQVAQAEFDLSGLPRVDALLVGKPVVDVVHLVERLCGICPSAHHLAGMRALESLAGLGELPPTADAIRRLLHHGGLIAIQVVGLISTHPEPALRLRRFAKAAMTAAGSPGHFPVTAVPGGVVALVDPTARQAGLELADDAVQAARQVAQQALELPHPPDPFSGADVALVNAAGQLDLFGTRLRAVAADSSVLIADARPADWDDLVAEATPGATAPRPYLRALGPGRGAYRVGPVAQLRVGALSTPLAGQLQAEWSARGGGAAAARAIVVLHAAEVITDLLRQSRLDTPPVALPWPSHLPAGVGVGWVDGARGLLVHRYATDDTQRVRQATILTPTAQNEPWLGELLREATHQAGAAGPEVGLEDAIREADPCLPCSTAPEGTMNLVVDTITAAVEGH
jgi:NAD-reducing hydrogenase large subunit